MQFLVTFENRFTFAEGMNDQKLRFFGTQCRSTCKK